MEELREKIEIILSDALPLTKYSRLTKEGRGEITDEILALLPTPDIGIDVRDKVLKINPDQLYDVDYTIDQKGNKDYTPTKLYGRDLTEKQIRSLAPDIGIEWVGECGSCKGSRTVSMPAKRASFPYDTYQLEANCGHCGGTGEERRDATLEEVKETIRDFGEGFELENGGTLRVKEGK